MSVFNPHAEGVWREQCGKHMQERLAKFMGTEESIIYSYDLATIPSVIPAFANAKDVIVCDEVSVHVLMPQVEPFAAGRCDHPCCRGVSGGFKGLEQSHRQWGHLFTFNTADLSPTPLSHAAVGLATDPKPSIPHQNAPCQMCHMGVGQMCLVC